MRIKEFDLDPAIATAFNGMDAATAYMPVTGITAVRLLVNSYTNSAEIQMTVNQ